MQKDDSKCSAGTKADSGQKDEDISVSQHSRKPNVGCSFSSHNDLFDFSHLFDFMHPLDKGKKHRYPHPYPCLTR